MFRVAEGDSAYQSSHKMPQSTKHRSNPLENTFKAAAKNDTVDLDQLAHVIASEMLQKHL